jgi:hypothetical protein
MPKVASARVHGLYGDPVKGMALKQLESAALTQLQRRVDQNRQISRCDRDQCEIFEVSAGAQERISSLKHMRDLTISSVLLESLGHTRPSALMRASSQASARICERSPRSETDESYESFAPA